MGGLSKARAEHTKPEKVRSRIQVGMILHRLHGHIRGRLEMSATQLKASEILLRKALPDLSAVEVMGEIAHNVINASPVQASDWAKEYVEDAEFVDVSQEQRTAESTPRLEDKSSDTGPLTELIAGLKRSQGS